MGRWLSPDWAAKPTAVPYAQYGDPQSLNLYGYVRDNPVNQVDADGHGGTNQCDNCAPDMRKERFWMLANLQLVSQGFASLWAAAATSSAQKQSQQKQTVGFGDPERTIQEKPGAAASRDVYYKSGKMDEKGNISDIDRNSTLTLHEKLDPNSKTKANICDKGCSAPNNGGVFVDLQFVPAGGSFRVLRDWNVGSDSVRVFDPETKKAYRYELNTNDANSKTPIKTEYTDTPPF